MSENTSDTQSSKIKVGIRIDTSISRQNTAAISGIGIQMVNKPEVIQSSALSADAIISSLSFSKVAPSTAVPAAWKAYKYSGAVKESELVKIFDGLRIAPKYSNKLGNEAFKVLKNKNFGAATLAISAGAATITLQSGLNIDLKYKLLIAAGVAIVVFIVVRILQEKDFLV